MANHGDYSSESSQGRKHGGYGSYSDCDDLSDDQSKVLNFALGSNKSGISSNRAFAGLLVVAIIFTLLFVLMNLPSFDRVMAQRIPNYNRRLAVKAFVFLFLVVVITLMAHQFWEGNSSSSRRDDCDDY